MAATNISTFTWDNLETGRFQNHQDTRTIISGQVLSRGALLAKITASGKYTQYDSGGSGGSEVPNAILAKDVDASTGDTKSRIYTFGEFNETSLLLMSGDSITDAIRATLRDQGIYLSIGQVE